MLRGCPGPAAFFVRVTHERATRPSLGSLSNQWGWGSSVETSRVRKPNRPLPSGRRTGPIQGATFSAETEPRTGKRWTFQSPSSDPIDPFQPDRSSLHRYRSRQHDRKGRRYRWPRSEARRLVVTSGEPARAFFEDDRRPDGDALPVRQWRTSSIPPRVAPNLRARERILPLGEGRMGNRPTLLGPAVIAHRRSTEVCRPRGTLVDLGARVGVDENVGTGLTVVVADGRGRAGNLMTIRPCVRRRRLESERDPVRTIVRWTIAVDVK